MRGIITIPPSTIHGDLTITDEDFAPVVSGASYRSSRRVRLDRRRRRGGDAALLKPANVQDKQNASRAPLHHDVSGGGARVAWVPAARATSCAHARRVASSLRR